jgi:hypothetical protein
MSRVCGSFGPCREMAARARPELNDRRQEATKAYCTEDEGTNMISRLCCWTGRHIRSSCDTPPITSGSLPFECSAPMINRRQYQPREPNSAVSLVPRRHFDWTQPSELLPPGLAVEWSSG